MGNPDSGRAHGQAGHIRAFPALSGALPDSQIQFPQRPVILSQEKVIVLTENRMNLRAPGTAAPLAAVTGNGGELFFQDRQHLPKVRYLPSAAAVPAEGSVRLFHGADPNQGAGHRIGQHTVQQDFRGKESGKDSGCVYLVHQQAFPPKSRFLPDPVQHPPLQQIAAALEHIHPVIPCPSEKDVIIVGRQSGKSDPPLLLQLAEGVQSPSFPEK